MLTLKQIKHLDAILAHKTVHRAAEVLHITQPALTRSLANLESNLGVMLFDRSRTGMIPTTFCIKIHSKCKQLLIDSDEIQREAKLYRGLDTGTLKFGLGIGNKALVLESLLPDYAIENPGIQIIAEEGKPSELIRRLLAREIDFLIAGSGSYENLENIQIQLIRKTDLHIVVGSNHPLLSLQNPSIDQLLKYPVLGVTTTAAKHPLNEHLNAAEINRQVVCSELSTLLAIVKKTNAWLLATEDQIAENLSEQQKRKKGQRKHIRSQELTTLQIEGFQPTSDLSIIECQGRSKSPAAAAFIEACFNKLSRTTPDHDVR